MAADFIQFIEYLLPGFLATWIFFGLTSYEKPSQFERVIQALIFTTIVQAFVALLNLFELYAPAESQILESTLLAIMLGMLSVVCVNKNIPHRWIIGLGISRETSYPSEWFGEFSKRVRYVILHLDDGRRIYGWPREWPSKSDVGHFSLEQAAWIIEGDPPTEKYLADTETILVPAGAVKFVEFVQPNE